MTWLTGDSGLERGESRLRSNHKCHWRNRDRIIDGDEPERAPIRDNYDVTPGEMAGRMHVTRAGGPTLRLALFVALFALSSVGGAVGGAKASTTSPGTLGTSAQPASSSPSRMSVQAAIPIPAIGNGLNVIVSERGRVSLSTVGMVSDGPAENYTVQKPSGATVRGAYIATATTGGTSYQLLTPVTLDGVSVPIENATSNSISSYNYFADVTSEVKHKIDAATSGSVSFAYGEPDGPNVDGSILYVIYDDPNIAADQTVTLMFGSLATAGDKYEVNLARPISLSDPNLRLGMSLGISYSYQSGGSQQYSIIDVNGSRLSTSAGGEDDGRGYNGALLTVGGQGDSEANPTDPYATPTSPRSDDELYNLKPFVHDGDQAISVKTSNPSHDDNILTAAFVMNPPVTSISSGSGSISPTAGHPDTLFRASWPCPAANGSLRIVDAATGQGVAVGGSFDLAMGLAVYDGTYDQTFQLPHEGSYNAIASCGGVELPKMPFTVAVSSPHAALGDSYSSGEGATSFDSGTGNATDLATHPNANQCHRSHTGWAYVVGKAFNSSYTTWMDACSGAIINDFYHYNQDNSSEVPQLDNLSRDKTKLVTLTVGGNDVGFGGVLTGCIYTANVWGALGRSDCVGHKFDGAATTGSLFSRALDRLAKGKSTSGCESLPGVNGDGSIPKICGTTVPLHQLYLDIASRVAPNATVIVATYPQLFGPSQSWPGGECVVGLASDAVDLKVAAGSADWMNSAALRLNNVTGKEVAKAQAGLSAIGRTDVKLITAPVDPSFDGHRLCDSQPLKYPWLNGLLMNGKQPLQVSFHPNQSGQSGYADAVRQVLK